MKVLILVGALFLTACAPVSTTAHGEIVSCDSINTSSAQGEELSCLDGNSKLAIESLRGPLVLNVWGSWCGPCKEEIPYFVKFYAKLKNKVNLLGVAVEEAKTSDAELFVHAHGITWPNLIDKDGSTRGEFGMGVPVTWFIADDGSVAYKHVGPVKSAKELEDLVAKHLGIYL